MKSLQNAERKCAAKGIFWLACPMPSAGGQPVAKLWVYSASHFLSSFSLVLVNVLGQHLKARTSKHLSAPKKPMRSRHSSQIGSMQYIVSHCPWIADTIGIDQYPVLASDVWPLFTLGGSLQSASTVTTSNGIADDLNTTPSVSGLSGPLNQPIVLPNQYTVPPNQPVVSPAHSSAAPDQPRATGSGVTPDRPDHVSNQPDLSLTWDWAAYVQASPTSEVANLLPSDEPLQLDLSASTVPATASKLPEFTFDTPSADFGTGHPPLPVSGSRRFTSDQPRLQAGNRAAAQTNINVPPKLLVGIADEPTWMKKKQTLDYFRGTTKLGSLSDVIEHWYELEGLLGFQVTVSVPTCSSRSAFLTFAICRLREGFRLQSGQQLSVCFTRMDTAIERTTGLKSTRSAVRSWSGGPRSVLLAGCRASGSGERPGFIPL